MVKKPTVGAYRHRVHHQIHLPVRHQAATVYPVVKVRSQPRVLTCSANFIVDQTTSTFSQTTVTTTDSDGQTTVYAETLSNRTWQSSYELC